MKNFIFLILLLTSIASYCYGQGGVTITTFNNDVDSTISEQLMKAQIVFVLSPNESVGSLDLEMNYFFYEAESEVKTREVVYYLIRENGDVIMEIKEPDGSISKMTFFWENDKRLVLYSPSSGNPIGLAGDVIF